MIVIILAQTRDRQLYAPEKPQNEQQARLLHLIKKHAAKAACGRTPHLLIPEHLTEPDAVFKFAESDDPYYLLDADSVRQYVSLANDIIVLAHEYEHPVKSSEFLFLANTDLLGTLGYRRIEAILPERPWENTAISFWQRTAAEKVLTRIVAAGDCDLHLHTSNSDGSLTTGALIKKVLQHRLKAFSITDHDTTAAIGQAQEYLASLPSTVDKPMFIPGIEISVDYNSEVHLLGYFPYGGHEHLYDLIDSQQSSREKRNEDMLKQLQELGYDIDRDRFRSMGDGTVGRLQAAQLLTESGYTANIQAAFSELLNPGKPAYIERKRPEITAAIRKIRLAGGVAVLAHPHLYGWCSSDGFVRDKLMDNLTDLHKSGLQGVEAFHGEASPTCQREVAAAGRILGLIRTAGSDDHGSNKETAEMYHAGTTWLPKKEVLVAAALIQGTAADSEQTWLLARRAEPGFGHGLWEVPGGKVEPGETTADALERELQEELALQAKAGNIRLILNHDYPDQRRIILVFHETKITDRWQLRVHDKIGYYTARQALELPLLAADIVLFQHLAKTKIDRKNS